MNSDKVLGSLFKDNFLDVDIRHSGTGKSIRRTDVQCTDPNGQTIRQLIDKAAAMPPEITSADGPIEYEVLSFDPDNPKKIVVRKK